MLGTLSRKASLFAAASIFAAAGAANAVTIYAVDNLGTTNSGSNGDRFIRFDSANPTGTIVTVGSTGVANVGLSGLDFSAGGTLYAASGFGSAFTTSSLYTINPGTGAATLVGSMGLSAANAITDMSWNPVTNQMQAIAGNGNFYTINLANGAASLVGTITGIAGGLDIGLATSSSGQNYVHDIVNDRMYTLGAGLVASPMSALIGIDTNFSQGMTINWSGANQWYLGSISSNPGFSSQVRLMNLATGGTSSILGTWPLNANGLPEYETGDLAIAPIPEPTSFALAALAMVPLMRRRSR